jgi:hypothetical protein
MTPLLDTDSEFDRAAHRGIDRAAADHNPRSP